MPFLLRNVPLAVGASEDDLPSAIARRLRVQPGDIRVYSITRRSLDARKHDLHFDFHVEVALAGGPRAEQDALRRLTRAEAVWIDSTGPAEPRIGNEPLSQRPVVIGFGPGGMFAALRLAEWGYKPLVLERGRDVRRRHRDIMHTFYRERRFNESSNLLFGEGGAGTYSDGKLYTRIHDHRCRFVLETLYHHGAPADILIDARPHVGSDKLPTVCARIRERIERLGGEIRFDTVVDDLRVEESRLSALHIRQLGDHPHEEWLAAGPTVLAIGHSARDTLRMLVRRGVRVVPKPFQLGVRIEHPQELVNRWQFGDAAGRCGLAAAEYHVIAKGAACERGDLFSFCMCPGGLILPTNESSGLIATNGASRAGRSGRFANSGLVITVDPSSLGESADRLHPDMAKKWREASEGVDDEARHALHAVAYQEHWERLAFEATGGSYEVPAQRADDFLKGRGSDGKLETSYPLGGRWTDIRRLVPIDMADSLARALPILDRRMPGFAAGDGLLTAPETRASAPFRILRDPVTMEAVRTANLFPIGEGAGYAGGIVSAAVDGLRAAEAIMSRYAPPR